MNHKFRQKAAPSKNMFENMLSLGRGEYIGDTIRFTNSIRMGSRKPLMLLTLGRRRLAAKIAVVKSLQWEPLF